MNTNQDKLKDLLEEVKQKLKDENESRLLENAGSDFEDLVVEKINEVIKEEESYFNEVEKQGTYAFPDIVVENGKDKIGIEVKTSEKGWDSSGNSVKESRRVDDLNKIYLFFARLDPSEGIEFKYDEYEKCLADVNVTHSPRYKINMELGERGNIFSRMDVDYDDIVEADKEERIGIFVEHFRESMDDTGDTWWIQGKENEAESDLLITPWNDLSRKEKQEYKIEAMVLFPQLFGESRDKYYKLALWLVTQESIMCHNVRDYFSSAGREDIKINGIQHEVSAKIARLVDNFDSIKNMLEEKEAQELSTYWNDEFEEGEKVSKWLDLVVGYSPGKDIPDNFKNALQEGRAEKVD
jgi:hypothetical protein